MQDSVIIEALERLGALYPWEEVAIWVTRKPAGEVDFTAYIASDYDRHTNAAFGHGKTIEEACQSLAKDAGVRDPEALREQKVKELREQLAKLQAAVFGPPPYRPGTRLAAGALNRDIEVAVTKEEGDAVPF